MKVNILDKIPTNFFELKPRDLHQQFGGPTLIDIAGESKETIFISTLLHGNETSSLSIIQKILASFTDSKPPKGIVLFFGNTLAAKSGLRHLTNQADFNRIWEEGELPENKLAMDVMSYARGKKLFASLDIHNNTGKNPNYGCINYLQEDFLKLASHFSHTSVYFTEPSNAQSVAFGKFCPAMTIEAGLSGSQSGIDETVALINYLLQAEQLDWNEKRRNVDLFHTIARMKVNQKANINFLFELTGNTDISFRNNLDDKNFNTIEVGSVLAKAKNLNHLRVESNDGIDITDEYFELEDNLVKTKKSFVPSMLTQLVYVIKEDCLGYIMESFTPAHK